MSATRQSRTLGTLFFHKCLVKWAGEPWAVNCRTKNLTYPYVAFENLQYKWGFSSVKLDKTCILLYINILLYKQRIHRTKHVDLISIVAASTDNRQLTRVGNT